MNELFLYDRDLGLFKEILNKSLVIEGRYHVSPSYGSDMNTNNLDSFIKDDKYGLSDVKQKYPICVCMTPRSRFVKFPSGQKMEEFSFNLFFVCKTNITGDNQIKQPDKDTNTSSHHVWYDWQDMKNCATSFIEILKSLLTRTVTIDGQTVPLKLLIQFDPSNAFFTRVTNSNNDVLSGVSVTFVLYMDASNCTLSDYPELDINTITIPTTEIHPLHKQ